MPFETKVPHGGVRWVARRAIDDPTTYEYDDDSPIPWMTDAGLKTLNGGYLLPEETPRKAYRRVVSSVAKALGRPWMEPLFMEAILKNWLCLASPVISNTGTKRGLPISCFGISVPDSVDEIYQSVHEFAMMSKNGGGVGVCLSNIRGRGASIAGNSVSEGVVPWATQFDKAVTVVNQGGTRRGAISLDLDVNHPDVEEFLRIRRPQGDVDRQCLHSNHCIQVDDAFMTKVDTGDTSARALWTEMLRSRLETGEPYLSFSDTVNRASPEAYKRSGLRVEQTNICSEITLHTDREHSFVCCLSSLNLARYEEWKDYTFSNGMTLPELATWFLDGVLEEYTTNAQNIPGHSRAVRSAVKGRAIGLGVLGWHSLLQALELPFDTSVEVMGLNSRIFKFMDEQTLKASKDLAAMYGEPEWCKGLGIRNTHRMALAPTVSNSLISGNLSASIEPIVANAYLDKTAKGSFPLKNLTLEKALDKMCKNTNDVWQSIVGNNGSVQHLDFLSDGQKEIFLTAREINQLNLIRQAAARQVYVDQSQSLNLFFPVNVDPRWFHRIHMEAWRSGIKTLYYCRSSSVLTGDVASRYYDESCGACEG